MKLTRMLALLAALLLCLTSLAAAETTISDKTFQWVYCELSQATNTLIVRRESSSAYELMDVNGNALSDEYARISANGSNPFFTVVNEEGVNVKGMIDAAGKLTLPMQYGDIDVINNDWIVGIVLEESTSENYDYTTFGSDKKFYLIANVDFYYQGQLAGTLDRLSYASATAHGKYLWVRSREGKYNVFNTAFEMTASDVRYSSEFDWDSKAKAVIHSATGLPAFTAGCTLTRDDVETYLYEINNIFYDLQGNAVFTDTHDIVYSGNFIHGDYAVTRNQNGKYGLINSKGETVLEERFDKIEDCNNQYVINGYVLASLDDKLCFVNVETGEERVMSYSASASNRYNSPFVYLTGMDGKVIVMSTVAGELPEHYAEVNCSYNAIANVLCVKRDDGTTGIIGMYGEEVVPFSEDNSSSRFALSYDGTVLLNRDNDYNKGKYTFHVMTIDYQPDASLAPAVVAAPAAVAAPADPDSWTCPSCGTVNTTKFCGECGTARPVQE